MDAAGLIEDYVASFSCQKTSICQGQVGFISPPCLDAFYAQPGVSGLGEVFDGFIPLMQDKFTFSD